MTSFFSRFRGGGRGGERLFVLGLDGVPHSFLREEFLRGNLPTLASLAGRGWFTPLSSVVPCVSSVAWATYMTGSNPGRHGIFGFVDHQPGSYDVFVPTSQNLRGKTLWEIVGEAGRKVIVVNVPVTYPPRPVNGILIGDFLGTSLDKLAHPPTLAPWLKSFGYRIDADARLARRDKAAFEKDVHETLEKRFAAALHLLTAHPWDFFQLHVMETDRVNHFLWPASAEDPLAVPFRAFYRRLDQLVGRLLEELGSGARLVVLSDHGFAPLVREVYLNQILREEGFLSVPEGGGFTDLLPETRAYSLIPGRIYVNLKGRQPRGSVEGADYPRLREEVTNLLLGLHDPATGKKIIRRVYRGEDLFHGGRWSGPFPAFPAPDGIFPPDLVAHPEDGYDLKGTLGKGRFGGSELTGMHTLEDAFLMLPGLTGPAGVVPTLADLAPTILTLLGLPVPEEMDGRPLVGKP
jgi:predicted AlkP superfamily phosphohydrolase/phosphomutase